MKRQGNANSFIVTLAIFVIGIFICIIGNEWLFYIRFQA